MVATAIMVPVNAMKASTPAITCQLKKDLMYGDSMGRLKAGPALALRDAGVGAGAAPATGEPVGTPSKARSTTSTGRGAAGAAAASSLRAAMRALVTLIPLRSHATRFLEILKTLSPIST